MDAVRIISANRAALARCGDGTQVVAEAWQAQALAQAVGGLLARCGPPEARAAAGALHATGVRPAGLAEARAARLTAVRDPRRTLCELAELLDELAATLTEVAAQTEEEALYWHCLEALDATGDTTTSTTALLASLP
ncbi:hypothetical protein JJV70_01290 [Streptomyces sp. JJ66]|uniref:DUF6099 family protein n=1 Tax=Streptomyces sp. JJ66 TaxID=2803843 RepID=UPI001C59E095|nr:DUF6099 family protein [Streptomyces sp. JJ66]MBW1600762.1 hypothetical protein [Streptomyces sp. JJ66]